MGPDQHVANGNFASGASLLCLPLYSPDFKWIEKVYSRNYAISLNEQSAASGTPSGVASTSSHFE
jgi:hypothetical protein